MSKVIFFLPYKPDPSKRSASHIRPMRMLEALRRRADVEVIWGARRERLKAIARLRKRILDGERFDFMYAEASTSPTSLYSFKGLPLVNLADHRFFVFCRKMGIPIGLFYRDVYWNSGAYRFDDSRGRMAMLLMRPYYLLDLALYRRTINHLFLPSERMIEYLPHMSGIERSALPAGMDAPGLMASKRWHYRGSSGRGIRIIYVGGIDTELYDARMLFRAVKETPAASLVCCFRKGEWEGCREAYEDCSCPRIRVFHEQGQGLAELYKEADIGSVFLKPVKYREFAMPFKLFEYLGAGLPTLGVEGTASGDFMRETGIGWVIPYEVDELKRFLATIGERSEEAEGVGERMEAAIRANTWDARAARIATVLGAAGSRG
jgi:glycosyltransferase involved in cell wall biosynthesis